MIVNDYLFYPDVFLLFHSDEDSDVFDGDLDVFPFDLKDATDPVEV